MASQGLARREGDIHGRHLHGQRCRIAPSRPLLIRYC